VAKRTRRKPSRRHLHSPAKTVGRAQASVHRRSKSPAKQSARADLAKPAADSSGRSPAQVASDEVLDWRRHRVPEPDWEIPLTTPLTGTVDGTPVVILAQGFTPVSSVGAGEKPSEPGVFTATLLAALEAYFDETRNPVFVWAARLEARRSGAAEPAWVTAYLDRVSWRMNAMSFWNTPRGDLPPAVYVALEFNPRRRSNPFRVIARMNHELELALRVSHQIKQLGKLDAAIFHVKNEHPTLCRQQPKCKTISYSKVLRIWNKHKCRIEEIDALFRNITPDLK
jgi:hypothetical protein